MTARVLIVDDIPTNVRLLEARLTAEYFEVKTASSGREALAICAQGATDIVLLDVMMPEMDGFEVCRRLKADIATSHIPVVMITALDQPSDRVKGLQAGADDFLTKPVDDVQLMARVKSLVRLKALTDELRARAQTGQEIAVEDAMRTMDAANADGGHILLVDSDARSADHDVRAPSGRRSRRGPGRRLASGGHQRRGNPAGRPEHVQPAAAAAVRPARAEPSADPEPVRPARPGLHPVPVPGGYHRRGSGHPTEGNQRSGRCPRRALSGRRPSPL